MSAKPHTLATELGDAYPAGTGGGTRSVDPVLEVDTLHVRYGEAIHAVRGVTLNVREGSFVALIGANGAGKTSLLRAITGLLTLRGGAIQSGAVRVDGVDVTGHAAAAIVGRGVSQVMEGRRVFRDLTVAENLRAGAHTRRGRGALAQSFADVMDMFPVLASRASSPAGYLSGGEQQMLAIGRALMQKPRILLLDEPSLGLAPIVVREVFEMLTGLNRRGTAVVVIEQNTQLALSVATYAYVIERGSIVGEGTASQLLEDEQAILAAYLGTTRTEVDQSSTGRGGGS